KVVFFTRNDPHLPLFAPRDLAIRSKAVETLLQYEVVWKELDRPLPEKAPEAPPAPRSTPVEELYRPVLVEKDRGGQCIIQRIGAAEQLVVRVGESVDGCTCTSIEREGEDWL